MNELKGKLRGGGGLAGHVGAGPVGGIREHDALVNRDKPDQHPIEAISGLRRTLDTIPPVAEALSNEELEALLR